MTALRIRNDDAARELVVRVWHRSNPFASDGDSSWLDEGGMPTTERSRDDSLSPGQTQELVVNEVVALTVLPASIGEPTGVVDSVRRYFHTGSTDSSATVEAATAVPFSLANTGTAPLVTRLFASATFQFSPLRELALAPGEAVQLSTGEAGISVRVG